MHHVVVGLTWLKKRLAALGLKRRNVVEIRLTLVHLAIKIHCDDATGSRLRKVKRLTRRTYVNKASDQPHVCSYLYLERSVSFQGPNWCWHIDGCDKLKPFGFPIHACIDGFSWKIIWLELTATNNDPDVVVKFYLDAVVKLEDGGGDYTEEFATYRIDTGVPGHDNQPVFLRKHLASLRVLASPVHQRVLSKKLEDPVSLLLKASSPADKAWLLSVSAPHAASWLLVTPPSLDLNFEPNEL
eukprot:Em0001g691a